MTARLWGQQTLVNTQIVNSQERPAVAVLNNGKLIVVWRDAQGPGGDIVGRLFNADGTPASAELVIGSGSATQNRPAVTALGNGGFMVAFEEGSDVTYRGFTEAGVADPDHVGTLVTAAVPAIVGSGFGAAFTMVTRQGASITTSRYDANADLINSQNTSPVIPAIQTNTDITRLSDGTLVMMWVSETFNILTRSMAVDGTLNSTSYQSNDQGPITSDARPKIAPLQDASFLVTWHGGGGTLYPASGIDVLGRIHTTVNGGTFGAGFLLNSRTTGNQTYSDVVALKDGGFMAVWASTSEFLRAQVFDPRGERLGPEIVVNTGGSVIPSLGIESTLMADGRVAIVWSSFGGADDNDGGVYMQIVDPRGGYVEGTGAPDTLYGHDAFDDLIIAAGGVDTVYAMGGADSVYAGDGADTVYGGTGNDIIGGGQGADFVSGDADNDLLYGDAGDDVLGGGQGIDLILGGGGNDWMEGGTDADTMLGEAGGDRLEGQDGNDVLDGGAGDDVMIGGAGNDIIYVDSPGDQVIEAAGGGIDIAYSSVSWLGNANVENLVLTGNAALNATMNNDANLVAGNGAANVINGAGGNDTIDGLGGIDWLGGGEGADRLDGGADNDTIQGGVGADSLYGGAGADSFYYGSYLDSNATQGIDSIQDFQVGIDKINLTPARLSATDSASIVYAYGNAYVFVDLYGDGINDMIIEVIGATTLSGADLNFAPPAAAASYYGHEETALTEAQQAAHHRASWDAVF